MPHAVCPACEEETYVSVRLQEGDLVRCRNCREQLEVIDTNPYELDWPYDSDSDDEEWDDESDEDEDSEAWDEDEEEEEDASWEAEEPSLGGGEDQEPEYQRRSRR